ncbi:hypothetical protein P167DRAFT_326892 [Morchella conica CCBAS932]|uniref:Secreted protein n=1 Tax=Morchella conica CCBAS932 TaxID=1392247 RepID=A0A3N4KL23_9PEZI|nr:hypothetical protein P167DRAFT_326892 [Morchella conica CCBAS932]
MACRGTRVLWSLWNCSCALPCSTIGREHSKYPSYIPGEYTYPHHIHQQLQPSFLSLAPSSARGEREEKKKNAIMYQLNMYLYKIFFLSFPALLRLLNPAQILVASYSTLVVHPPSLLSPQKNLDQNPDPGRH